MPRTMDYVKYELPNGLRVLAAPMGHVRSVSTAVFVGVGSRYESDAEAGSAHLIEHLMFRGTRLRPSPRLISEPIERIGGVINASTDKEATVYWTKTAAEHLPLSVELLADMLLHSRVTPTDVAKEKDVIVEELSMSMDDPQDWVHNLIDQCMWPGHPIGRDVGGTRESVRRHGRRALREFMGRHYTAANSVLVVAGGVKAGLVKSLAKRHFGQWTASSAQTFTPAPARVLKAAPALQTKPTEQAHLCLAFPGLSRYSPERFALDILVTILGGGSTSRLFLQLRERLALAYDVHAYTTRYADTGSIVVYAGLDARRAARAVTAIRNEIERVRSRSITAAEVEKTVQYMKGRMYLGLEDTHAVASWLGSQELLTNGIISPEDLVSTIERVRLADVRGVARELLDPEYMHIAAIGPNVDAVAGAARA